MSEITDREWLGDPEGNEGSGGSSDYDDPMTEEDYGGGEDDEEGGGAEDDENMAAAKEAAENDENGALKESEDEKTPAEKEQEADAKGEQEDNGGTPKNDNADEKAPATKLNVKDAAKKKAGEIKDWTIGKFTELWNMITKDIGKKIRDIVFGPVIAMVVKIKKTVESVLNTIGLISGGIGSAIMHLAKELKSMIGGGQRLSIVDVVLDLLKGFIVKNVFSPIMSMIDKVIAIVKPLLDFLGKMLGKATDILKKYKAQFPELCADLCPA